MNRDRQARKERWVWRGYDQFNFVQEDFGTSAGSLSRDGQRAGGIVAISVAGDLGFMVEDVNVDERERMW